MENNEENLNSQEPETIKPAEPTAQPEEPISEPAVEKTEEPVAEKVTEPTQSVESKNTGKEPNTRLIGIIAVAAVAILALILIIFTFFTRSPKSAVKDWVKAFNKGNAKKVMAVMDYEGMAAFGKISNYSFSKGYTYDFEDFDDEYDDIMDQVKDMDKDQKEDYKELKEKATDQLQDTLDEFKESKAKISVKKVKTEKIDDCKKLTKVVATLELKMDGEKDERDFTFYTMKKGLKNYVVYAEFN